MATDRESEGARARSLNASCLCTSVDRRALEQALAMEAEGFDALVASHPHLFASEAVFVDRSELDAVARVVAAVERVVALPAYREAVMATAHPNARIDPRARGVFLGFDFHLDPAGPKLIEINSNAGGALLNAALRRAQRTCCSVERPYGEHVPPLETRLVEMFREEWRLARGDLRLRTVAIVDDDPAAQYLAPEFAQFVRTFEAHGLAAFVADARELVVQDGALRHDGRSIDLVYNRLVDFSLSSPSHAALATALGEDLAVITPHPRTHALYADKSRLSWLGDPAKLAAFGADPADIEVLREHVPQTRDVRPEDREELWRERKRWFFKPLAGHGSKAVYRGDKITRAVFERVLVEPYVAQAVVDPSERAVRVGEHVQKLKLDLRAYAYAGDVQLCCARLYHGQTTNFRTAGGGFAAVFGV